MILDSIAVKNCLLEIALCPEMVFYLGGTGRACKARNSLAISGKLG